MRLRAWGARGWLAPVALIAVVTLGALVANYLPPEPAAVVRLVLGVITTAAMLLGAHIQGCRPKWAWLVMGAGIGVWVAGDFLWDSLAAHNVPDGSPWFTVANCLYVITYPALFAAVVGLVNGSLKGNLENAADGATFALAAVVLLRMFAVDSSFTGNTLDTLFNAAYPLGDALLIGGVMWLFFTTGVRSVALWLLSAGVIAMLVTDVLWDLEVRYGLGWLDPWIGPAYPITYAFIAATALHPSARQLSVVQRPMARYVHRARLSFLCATLGLVSLVALVGNRADAVLDVCTVVLVTVIAIRFAALVRATETAYRTADRSERRFRALATGVPVGLLEADPSMHIVFANEESERQLGMPVTGLAPADLGVVIADSASEEERHSVSEGFREVILGRRSNAQIRIRGPLGTERWLAWYAMPAGDGPHTGAFLATVDITALKDAEAMLSLQATHDALTGLPNRRLLYDRLSQALTALERQDGTLAVLYMDLDRFKPVNDELGHDAGDRLLQVIAGRIQTVVRSADTVARVGGDEFVVVLTQLPSQLALARGVAAGVADKIVRAVSLPVDLLGHRVKVGVSVGVATCIEPDRDPDALLRDADAAMYLAKRGSGARYTFFDDEVTSPQAADRLVVERHHSVDLPAS